MPTRFSCEQAAKSAGRMTKRLGLVLAAAVLCGASSPKGEPPPEMVLRAFEDVVFVPLVPSRPELAQIAILKGNPDAGPSDMLLRMTKGEGRRHVHSADYRLVVLKGTMKHWVEVGDRPGAKLLKEGSYWFQPANQPHGDDCLSEQCLMFISWTGKRDTKLAE